MSALTPELRLRVVSLLINGNSISSTVKMTGVAKTTILRLVVKLGRACRRMHNALVRDLRSHFIELDEQWSFVGLKEKRKTEKHADELGDVFTFTALCRTSRLAIAYAVGKRTQEMTDAFVKDVRARLLVAPVVSMDGYSTYPAALAKCFEVVDAGQVIKKYGYATSPDHKYEPARDAHFIRKTTVLGAPAMADLGTSKVERYHGTMRHTNGRKRRLSYAFSRSFTNHEFAVDISIAAYNWTHVLRTTGKTPAHAANLTDHTWTLEELLETAFSMPETDDAPVAKPLELRDDAGPARELPNGRGFLRLVGAPAVAPSRSAPRPVQVSPIEAAPVAPVALVEVPPPAQGDLFEWAASHTATARQLDPWEALEAELPAAPEKQLPALGSQLGLFDQ